MTPTPTAPVPIQHFRIIDSTSQHARRFVNSGAASAPILFIADEQTGGVGRFARPWASPRGGLWCTLLWPLPPPPSLSRAALSKEEGRGEGSSSPASPSPPPPSILDGLGLRIGIACLNTVRAAIPADLPNLDLRLKWPNDILINNRKVLGVLCEIVHHDHLPFALVGVGINANLNIDDLPPPLRPAATTLRAAIGRDVDLAAIAADLTRRLTTALTTHGLDPATLAAARTALARVGDPIRVTLPNRSTLEGTLTGLSNDGRPTLHTLTGPITLPPGAELL